MGGVQVGWRGVGQWGRWRKTSVQTFSNLFLKTLTQGAVTTEAGSLFQYFTTLSFVGGSHLGVSYSGALLSRAEWEGEKKRVRIIIQKTREYLEGGNQVSPKPSPLQSLFVGEVTNASYQPCSESLNSL